MQELLTDRAVAADGLAAAAAGWLAAGPALEAREAS